MAIEVDISVNGLRELENNLLKMSDQYGPKNALSALRTPMRKALKSVEDILKVKTPVDTGELKNSVKIRITQPKKGELKNLGGHINPESILVARAGWFWKNPSLWNRSLAVEFGNRRVAARPVLMPAFDNNKERILSIFKDELKINIEKTAKRLNKRIAAGKFTRR